MSRCLVTGHCGYIGSKLFKQLKSLGHEVQGIDQKAMIGRDIKKTLREDNDGLFHRHFLDFQPEFIFHMACWPRVGYCLDNPVKTMENNVIGGSIVLNYARKVGSVKRFIYSSSSSVVGNGSGPTNPYALQKYVTELETKIYADVYGLESISLRYFNVYSECQTIDGPYVTAVANWMKNIRENKKSFITGNGEQRRDMVHVNDVVSANIFAMNHKGAFGGNCYDVGTGENISLNEVKAIVQKFHNVDFNYVEGRPGEVLFTKADIAPLSDLGWKHSISISEGLKRCFSKESK
jgi:nucleoside-diphosphate-sugar epimerase